MNKLAEASSLLEGFRAGSLRTVISRLEESTKGLTSSTLPNHFDQYGICLELLLAALLIKRSSAQINEIVHAIGVLLTLPYILEPGETVQGLSLAAGNTGKGFDLETTHRIAEFTFIQWQGGSEVIRQNKIFKDFYFLAESDSPKKRELYVVGKTHPERFFESGRALAPILRGNSKLGNAFSKAQAMGYATVRDYYQEKKGLVAIRDLSEFLPALQS